MSPNMNTDCCMVYVGSGEFSNFHREKKSQFLTQTSCIISSLAAWADKTHNIKKNNGLLGFSLTTMVRYIFGFIVTGRAMKVAASIEITPESSLGPSIHSSGSV